MFIMLLVTLELLSFVAVCVSRDLVRIDSIRHLKTREADNIINDGTRRSDANTWITESANDYISRTIFGTQNGEWEMSMSMSPSTGPIVSVSPTAYTTSSTVPSAKKSTVSPTAPGLPTAIPVLSTSSYYPSDERTDMPSLNPDLGVPSETSASPMELTITPTYYPPFLPVQVPTTGNSSISSEPTTPVDMKPASGNSNAPESRNYTTLDPNQRPTFSPGESNEVAKDDTEGLSVSPWSLATLSLICASTVVAIAAFYRKRAQSNRHMELVEDESVGSPQQA